MFQRNEKKNIFAVTLCLFMSAIFFSVANQALATTNYNVIADITLSNSTSFSFKDTYLYLTNTVSKKDEIVIKTPQNLSAVKHLFIYSNTANTVTAQIEIQYISADFLIGQTNLVFSPIIDTVSVTIKPGFVDIPLFNFQQNNPVYGIKLTLITNETFVFYGSATDVGPACTHKFSPYLSDNSNGVLYNTPDQLTPDSPALNINSKSTQYISYTNMTPVQGTKTKNTRAPTKDKYNQPFKPEVQVQPLITTKAESIYCTIYDRHKTDGSIETKCHYPAPQIISIANNKVGDYYKISVVTKIPTKLQAKIIHYECKPPSLFEFNTLFSCVPYWSETESKTVDLNSSSKVIINKKSKKYAVLKEDTTQEFIVFTKKDPGNKILTVKTKYSYSLNTASLPKTLGSTSSTKVSNIMVVPPVTNISSKPLSFVFENPVGVTQWHGKTAFSKFHTGIDFAVNSVQITSPADGIVNTYAWDSYQKCYSGGNILRVQHYSDVYSVYMHLSSTQYAPGKEVLKGQMLATSGNTGLNECEPIGYHLHLETRKSPKQKDAVNPVDMIDTDWSKIYSANAKKYPGRLTGNNPHPRY